MASHKYWRVVSIKKAASGNECGFDEVEMAATVSGSNLASGQTYTASSTKGASNTADKAFDGSNSSDWVTSGFTNWGWIQVEFATAQSIGEIRLMPPTTSGAGAPVSIMLLACDDGAFSPATTEIYLIKSGLTYTANTFTSVPVPANPIPAMTSIPTVVYWRAVILSKNGTAEYYMAEMEMATSVSGTDQCTGGTASSASSSSLNTIARLFDNSLSNDHASENNHQAGWVQYALSSATKIKEFRITASSSQSGRAPKDIVFMASSANTDYDATNQDWVIVKRSTSQTGWTANEVRSFSWDDPGVFGNLAATLADDTVAATGSVPVVGNLAATLAADAVAATGSVPVIGNLAATLDADTLAATATVLLSGNLAATLSDDAAAATGYPGDAVVGVVGESPIILDDDTLDATATVELLGDLAVTLDGDGLAALAIVGSNGPFTRRRMLVLNG